MPSLIDLRRRIRSVKNTQQITKAMKMVAAAKLRRAQERMFAARPYAAALREVLSSVATRVDVTAHALLSAHEVERNVLIIPVTADRGLCGAFNANVIRATQNFIRDKQFEAVHLPNARLLSQDIMREIMADGSNTRPLVLVDHQGKQALDAAAYFMGHGLQNVRCLKGGIDAWAQVAHAKMPRYRLS